MKTRILVTFATEDPVTAAHDEIICRLCSGLADRGICGEFHVTGDYVRFLRKRGSFNVRAALREHEIGYHTNTHASYPFLGEYGETLPWDDAVARYMQTEARGVEDVADFIGRDPQYIVTEFLKVPQLVESYRRLGFRYAGLNSGMPDSDTSAICYMGMYCFAGPIFGMERAPYPGRLEAGLKELGELLEKRPPAMKIFLHPYKLLYNSGVQAWYGENNFYRHYDPALPWREPGKSLYTPEVTDLLLREFFALLDFAAQYDVEFVKTAPYLSQFKRPSGEFVSRKAAADLWEKFKQAHDYIGSYTPAEITAMRSFALAHPEAESIPVRMVCGPAGCLKCDPAQSAKEAEIFFEYNQRMPEVIAPELYVCDYPESAKDPAFAEETWTRDIYPDGFTGREICRLARLQSWSFRPAEIS